MVNENINTALLCLTASRERIYRAPGRGALSNGKIWRIIVIQMLKWDRAPWKNCRCYKFELGKIGYDVPLLEYLL